jgi:hypothetical protein
MTTLTPQQAETIKAHFFRCREHLDCAARTAVLVGHKTAMQQIARSTYEICRGFRLSAIKHPADTGLILYYDDAVHNLTTLIDFDLSPLKIDSPEDALMAAVELESFVKLIPLPN